MKVLKLILIILLAILLIGCSTRKVRLQKESINLKESKQVDLKNDIETDSTIVNYVQKVNENISKSFDSLVIKDNSVSIYGYKENKVDLSEFIFDLKNLQKDFKLDYNFNSNIDLKEVKKEKDTERKSMPFWGWLVVGICSVVVVYFIYKKVVKVVI